MRIRAGVDPVGEFEPQSATRPVEEPRGNPLWPIALESLSATRERPIFLPSRRRPSPVFAAASPSPPPIGVPPPVKPEYPRLTLLGSVTGQSEDFAVFIDQGDRGIVRLRTGEDHRGWTLRSVQGREAILQKDRETLIFSLPAPNEGSAAPVSSAVVTPPAASDVPGAPIGLAFLCLRPGCFPVARPRDDDGRSNERRSSHGAVAQQPAIRQRQFITLTALSRWKTRRARETLRSAPPCRQLPIRSSASFSNRR
jgi:general secretion pathway protein N